jgi:hypothetical protein
MARTQSGGVTPRSLRNYIIHGDDVVLECAEALVANARKVCLYGSLMTGWFVVFDDIHFGITSKPSWGIVEHYQPNFVSYPKK